ncbi:MAG: RHS repeat-associated core domain-containing protein, partial [Candidatus Kerfeldbacteria bacterium]|nr:RHS repeat-associated core domain-containing protein [Candidatus Kerfeldbacteria bacterium]
NLTQAPTVQNPYTYTGREWDAETGFYYYRARYYEPKVGRFLQQDPIELEGGDLNFYAYVRNNPVNYKDPMGLEISPPTNAPKPPPTFPTIPPPPKPPPKVPKPPGFGCGTLFKFCLGLCASRCPGGVIVKGICATGCVALWVGCIASGASR